MRKKHFLFAALFFAALALGFVGCENPNGDLLNNGDDNTGITDNDSTTNNPNQGGDNNGGTKPTTPEAPTLVATGDATEVGRSSVKLWGRINTDTLWAFNNVKWGIECSTTKEAIHSHSGNKTLCSTDLVGENSDEYAVAFTGLEEGKMLYYNAYLLINDIKYIYGEMDSVHLDVILTINTNNSSYGTVTGSGTYDHLAEATITATPKENYYFTGWSDCDSKELTRTITLTSDSTITANFAKKPYLTVKSNNTSYGTVTGSGYYMPGDEVTITATPRYHDCMFVEWNDGNTDNPRTVIVNEDITYTATLTVNPIVPPTCTDYVDLGLSVKWATCNVGASSPEELGCYFAWGETTPKTSYSWSTYKWCNGSYDTMTKYCTDSDYGTVDNKTVLDPEDDAASVNMGGSWRMPTYEEQTELLTECTWTLTTLNGVNGYNVEGPNGNSIFLPAAGGRLNSDLSHAGSGNYWSSSLWAGNSYGAYYIYFCSDYVVWFCGERFYAGLSVRGVFSE